MNNSQFENLHFNRMVNTIKSFPEVFPLHWHKHVELLAVPLNATESVKISLQGVEYLLEPGDLFWIWPGELHEILDNPQGTAIGMQFSPSYISDLPDFAPYVNLFRSKHLISYQEDTALAESMQIHLHHMMESESTGESFHGVQTLICLYELFIEFGTEVRKSITDDSSVQMSGSYRTWEKINSACSYIADNCERELTLEMAADYAGFSACYFSRIFKQITTYHFVEYLTIQRVKKAQFLLSDSDISITEISYQSGFKSISTFNRVFKQVKGCSPSEYRKYYSS